jgi:hypothetical protein
MRLIGSSFFQDQNAPITLSRPGSLISELWHKPSAATGEVANSAGFSNGRRRQTAISNATETIPFREHP